MYVAVPKTGGGNQTFAVNDSCTVRDFDFGGWPNAQNATLMYKNRPIFDRRFSRGGINL